MKRLDAGARTPLADRILKQREGKDVEVSLERLEAEFGDARRYDIVAALKELEKAGKGQFFAGRRGQKARFAWGEKAPPAKQRPGRTARSDNPRSGANAASNAESEAAPAPARRGRVAKKVRAAASKRGAPAAAAPAAALPGAAPALSDEPSPKGSTRKVLAPLGQRTARPRLSRPEAAPEPLPDPLPDPERLGLAAREPGRSLQHAFHLRPGVRVTIELPEDVTPTEVDRFCHFLKAIPFAGSKG